MKARKVFLCMFLWILFALYPNPANLAISLYRLYEPDIDPEAVQMLSANSESDPAKVKTVVEKMPYEHDWQVYGMPWYFPTVKEVLEKGRGDCKAQAILLASILQNKAIESFINYSLTHMWVDYQDKPETIAENADRAVLQVYYPPSPQLSSSSEKSNGENNAKKSAQVQIPAKIGGDQLAAMKDGLWDAMPVSRKILLFGGLAVLVFLRLAVFIGEKKRKKPLGV